MPYDNYSALRVKIDAGVALVTIDHPPLNVYDAALITDLHHFAAAVSDDKQVRVIVLQSADPEFFICHGDMNFVTNPDSLMSLADADGDPQMNPMEQLHERFRRLPQITIAKVAGLVRGGGNELTMSLDMRFAAQGQAGFAHPEVLGGIIPGGGGTQYLPRLVGRARSLEAILGAGLYDAELAERYGWINRALPAKELDGFVDVLARRIAALPPAVIAAAKAAVDATAEPLTNGLREENTLLGEVFQAPAVERTLAILKAGGQTRERERNLEGLLNSL